MYARQYLMIAPVLLDLFLEDLDDFLVRLAATIHPISMRDRELE